MFFTFQHISASCYLILTLIPSFFCILLLLFENFKIEVGQLHYVYFPATFQKLLKLVIFSKLSSEKNLENIQKEVGQLQFNIFQKIGAKCKKINGKLISVKNGQKLKTLLKVESE